MSLVRRRSCGCDRHDATARPRSASAASRSATGPRLALQPTDLEIAEGEFFCLLGPSGCGKTTTLNLIGGFVNAVERRDPHPRRAGRPAAAAPAQRQHRLPVVRALPAHDGARERRLRPQDGARPEARVEGGRIEEALALVGLEEFGDRLPGQLSGGQQQRVAVARALVNRPAVLLLDEPLGALDLKLRQRLQVELSQIHRDVGTTFVYVTHDQEEAMSMATRIAVMSDGRIQQIGTPSEIYYQPRSPVRRRLHRRVELPRRRGRSRRQAALADGRAVPCPRTAGAGGTGDADGAARVDPVRRPADAPDGALRGRIVQTSFLGSQTRVAVTCDACRRLVTAAQFGRERTPRDLARTGRCALVGPGGRSAVAEVQPKERRSK